MALVWPEKWAGEVYFVVRGHVRVKFISMIKISSGMSKKFDTDYGFEVGFRAGINLSGPLPWPYLGQLLVI